MSINTRRRIVMVSRCLRIIFLVVFFALPLFYLWYWLSAGFAVKSLGIQILPAGLPSVTIMPLYVRIVGFIVSLIPIVFQMLILFFLIKLFKRYERGQIFLLTNARYIKNIGITLLIYQLITPFYQLLISYVVTVWRGHHHGYMFIKFGSPQIHQIVLAVIIILVAWVMQEGCKLEQEQRLTI